MTYALRKSGEGSRSRYVAESHPAYNETGTKSRKNKIDPCGSSGSIWAPWAQGARSPLLAPGEGEQGIDWEVFRGWQANGLGFHPVAGENH
jgi:hypothetical protein